MIDEELHSERLEIYRKRKRFRKLKNRILIGVGVLITIFLGIYFFQRSWGTEATKKLSLDENISSEETSFAEATPSVVETTMENPEEFNAEQGEGKESSKTENLKERESEENVRRQAEKLLEEMTMEERVYQLFIVTQEQLTGVSQVTQSGVTTKDAVRKYPVGGVIYFGGNLITRDQCQMMIQNLQSYAKTPLFIAVDEEGGTVARLGKNPSMETTVFPAMKEIGASGDPQEAYRVGYTIGSEMKELGFNLDFAPVADIWSNPENTVIGSRAFGSDAKTVAEMIAACVKGFQESDTLCTLKHFPGHGDTKADSHYGMAESLKTLEELYDCELVPFQAGIEVGVPFIMIGHISLPNITVDNVPVTLSKEIVTDLLRNEMGYQGIIITDSMSMGAITERYSSGESAVQAILAGVDVILMPKNLQDAAQGILEAVEERRITEERINESVLRILEVKIKNGIITIEND